MIKLPLPLKSNPQSKLPRSAPARSQGVAIPLGAYYPVNASQREVLRIPALGSISPPSLLGPEFC